MHSTEYFRPKTYGVQACPGGKEGLAAGKYMARVAWRTNHGKGGDTYKRGGSQASTLSMM